MPRREPPLGGSERREPGQSPSRDETQRHVGVETADNVRYVLEHCEASLLFVGKAGKLAAWSRWCACRAALYLNVDVASRRLRHLG